MKNLNLWPIYDDRVYSFNYMTSLQFYNNHCRYIERNDRTNWVKKLPKLQSFYVYTNEKTISQSTKISKGKNFNSICLNKIHTHNDA